MITFTWLFSGGGGSGGQDVADIRKLFFIF